MYIKNVFKMFVNIELMAEEEDLATIFRKWGIDIFQ